MDGAEDLENAVGIGVRPPAPPYWGSNDGVHQAGDVSLGTFEHDAVTLDEGEGGLGGHGDITVQTPILVSLSVHPSRRSQRLVVGGVAMPEMLERFGRGPAIQHEGGAEEVEVSRRSSVPR